MHSCTPSRHQIHMTIYKAMIKSPVVQQYFIELNHKYVNNWVSYPWHRGVTWHKIRSGHEVIGTIGTLDTRIYILFVILWSSCMLCSLRADFVFSQTDKSMSELTTRGISIADNPYYTPEPVAGDAGACQQHNHQRQSRCYVTHDSSRKQHTPERAD